MLFNNEENIKEKSEIADYDNDGHESVTEYYTKKKNERKDEEEQKKADKKNKGNKDEEIAKTVIQSVGSFIPHVPTIAAFGAGAGLGGMGKDVIKKMIEEMLNGKK